MMLFNKMMAAAVVWVLVGSPGVAEGQTPVQFEDSHLFASDGAAGDNFGYSVSVSGIFSIVGAHTAAGFDTGSAYINRRINTTTWVEIAHLFASDGVAGDFFGESVSIDGTVAIVGAFLDDTPGGIGAGSAYIYRFTGPSWGEEAHLFASDGATLDQFGKSVSVSGNVAIVGAYQDDTATGFDSGSAYVFRFNGTNWVEEAHLFASDGQGNTGLGGDEFGQSVSVSGNVAIIGAFEDDTPGGFNAGSAYVFRFNGTNWIEEAHLFASDGAALDLFGDSVSIRGNVAIVGAFFDQTTAGPSAGSAYIYRFNGTNWIEEAHLFASDGAEGDEFGISVSVSGAPGSELAIVGAQRNNVTSGSAYIYRFNGTNWVEERHLFASDGSGGDFFGGAVSVSGDFALGGARLDSTAGGFTAGSAYVFHVPEPPCFGDLAPPGGNGTVNIDDLVFLLGAFGPCPAPPTACPADIAPPGGNGVVNIDDLVLLLGAFGFCLPDAAQWPGGTKVRRQPPA